MQAFVAVVEAKSFSAAARQLGVGQPAVSKTVAQLEDRLGVRLLLRSTRRLSTTGPGQNFYEHAKLAIAEADEAELAARGAGAGLSGRLRVSAAVTFARLNVVPRLAPFLAKHPLLDIELVLDDRSADLVGEGIDIGLRMGKPNAAGPSSRRIGSGRRLVLATPDYIARHGAPRTPEDLAGCQAVLYAQRGGGETWTFRKGEAQQTITLGGRIRTTAAEGLREAVFAGLGLAVATEWLFGPELRSGAVREVLGDWSLPPIDLWAMFPTGRRPSAKARAFAAFVEHELNAQAVAPH
jgi:DNA-binding transcriptional LysR family regulator